MTDTRREKWVMETKRADFKAIAGRFGIDPVVARLIRNRGAETEEEVDIYLHGGMERLHDALLMKDMQKAADAVLEYIDRGDKIRIVGDYDVDGISATYILLKGLTRLGADADWYIPDRITDGYGINENIVTKAAEDGTRLILTCDNGISARDALAKAAELGMGVVVTDHHDVPQDDGHDLLPPALAVVDPHRADSDYPFEDICGAVVAWKLISVLYAMRGVDAAELDPLLEFAGLATIADVMPLQDENRVIAGRAIEMMKSSANVGLKHLLEVNSITADNITSDRLAFHPIPCLNAAGRLTSAADAMRLLLCDNAEDAEECALELKNINSRRKDMTAQILETAMDIIENSDLKNDKILVVYIPGCHESLAGIVAGKLREHFGRPAIVLADGETCLKGSARSTDSFHISDAMRNVRDLLIKFGGHPLAAGLSIDAENVDEFRRRINEECTVSEEDMNDEVRFDMLVPLAYLNEDLVDQLSMLEPCGTGNPAPLFAQTHLKLLTLSLRGANQNVAKLRFEDEHGCRMNGVLFNDVPGFLDFIKETYGEDALRSVMSGGRSDIDIAVTYHPQINEWKGRHVEIVVENYCKIDR